MMKFAAPALTVCAAMGLWTAGGLAQSVAGAPLEAPTALYRDAVVGSAVEGTVDAKAPIGAALTYRLSQAARHGQVLVDDPRYDHWTYRPEKTFSGSDEFFVTVSDGRTARTTRIVILLSPKPTRVTYYVDAARGSDKNPGTASAPFATIQAAHDVTCPGDTVLVRDGTYLQQSDEGVLVVSRSGLPGAMITYKAYPGEHPILHAITAWNHVLITASYIRVEGLEIAGNARNVSLQAASAVAERFMKGKQYETFGPETSAYETNGISIRPKAQNVPVDQRIAPRHVEVVGNRIHDMQGGGLSAMGADYILFERNAVYDTSYRAMYANSGISVLGSQNTDNETPAYKILILANLVYRNRTEVKWAQKKAMSDGNGIIIDSNRNKGDLVGPYSGRMLIANNVVYESGGAGVQVFSSDKVQVLQNTVVRNSLTPHLNYGQIWVHQASQVLVENNIVVAGTGDGAKINEAFNDTNDIVYDYNIYFGGNKPEIMGPHDRIADPMFVSEKDHDFHLTSTSPASAAGNKTQALLKDFDEHSRPRDTLPDVGAFQH